MHLHFSRGSIFTVVVSSRGLGSGDSLPEMDGPPSHVKDSDAWFVGAVQGHLQQLQVLQSEHEFW